MRRSYRWWRKFSSPPKARPTELTCMAERASWFMTAPSYISGLRRAEMSCIDSSTYLEVYRSVRYYANGPVQFIIAFRLYIWGVFSCFLLSFRRHIHGLLRRFVGYPSQLFFFPFWFCFGWQFYYPRCFGDGMFLDVCLSVWGILQWQIVFDLIKVAVSACMSVPQEAPTRGLFALKDRTKISIQARVRTGRP
jgi:hypothetical protein